MIDYFQQMRRHGMHPNEDIYSVMIDVFAKDGNVKAMRSCLEEIKEANLQRSIVTYASIVDDYERGRQEVGEIDKLVEEVKQKGIPLSKLPPPQKKNKKATKQKTTNNTIIDQTWRILDAAFVNNLVDAYGRLGHHEDTEQVVLEMQTGAASSSTSSTTPTACAAAVALNSNVYTSLIGMGQVHPKTSTSNEYNNNKHLTCRQHTHPQHTHTHTEREQRAERCQNAVPSHLCIGEVVYQNIKHTHLDWWCLLGMTLCVYVKGTIGWRGQRSGS